MAIFRAGYRPDPLDPCHCDACGWKGMIGDAVCEPESIVLCPCCAQPVTSTDIFDPPVDLPAPDAIVET